MNRSLRIAVLAVLIMAPAVRGDGGTLRLSRRAGDWQVSVFTSPSPLRAGPVDVSVLVQQSATGRTLLDVPVLVRVWPVGQPERAQEMRATSEAATNKLFQAAALELPDAGRYHVTVSVGESDALLEFEMEAEPPPPAWLDLAAWIGWPFALVLLFVVHQMLMRRQSTRGNEPCGHAASLRASRA
jgi:hypothetical protein